MEKLRFAGEFDPWEEKKLGEVLVNFNKKTNKNNEFPVISSTRTGIYLQEDYFTKQVASADNKGYKIVPRGYATYRSMSDTTDFTFNIQDIVETAIVSPAYPVFTTVNGINLEYLIEVMNHSHIFKNDITKALQGGTRSALPFSRLADLSVNLPSLPEQEKIGGFLSALDEGIECQSELVDLLALEYKGYSQRIFSQEMRFKDENGNEYPEWEEKKLGELIEIGGSGGTPLSSTKEYYGGDYPFLSISDITKQGKYITSTSSSLTQFGVDNSGAWVVPSRSIIYAMYASVGKLCINNYPVTTSQALYAMRFYNEIDINYMYSALERVNAEQLNKVITQGTQKNINAKTLKNFNIPLPSLPEQEKIGGFLSSLSERIEAEKELLDQLKERKKAYLQKLFP